MISFLIEQGEEISLVTGPVLRNWTRLLEILHVMFPVNAVASSGCSELITSTTSELLTVCNAVKGLHSADRTVVEFVIASTTCSVFGDVSSSHTQLLSLLLSLVVPAISFQLSDPPMNTINCCSEVLFLRRCVDTLLCLVRRVGSCIDVHTRSILSALRQSCEMCCLNGCGFELVLIEVIETLKNSLEQF
jgi:hypothetical protein